MGGIDDRNVEWAVVSRLKAMLDKPPRTRFNVTQSFALFSAILLWTKQRTWVGGDQADRPAWFTDADHAARNAREMLRTVSIFDAPWGLARVRPRFRPLDERDPVDLSAEQINDDFEGVTAEQFIKWLRNALAHGDGRTIRPLHKPSSWRNKSLLAGFEIASRADVRSKRLLTLSLYHADMTRIGAILADSFCTALSGGDRYFEEDSSTRSIIEAA